MRKEVIGDCTLYLGNCLEVMPTLGRVDAVVDNPAPQAGMVGQQKISILTDPPYGIGVDKTMSKQGGTKYGNAAAAKSFYEDTDWDSEPIGDEFIKAMLSISSHQIIFGGNYFSLPPARCWLIWDKENGSNAFADAEMAWTNLDKPVRVLRHMWNGMLRKGGEDRYGHPTQKPVGVMEWCINHLPKDTQTILDPFMGSGTTGIACVKLGRKFIGIELDEKYFDIACKRIKEAYRQPDMFIEQAIKVKQESLI